MSNETLGCSIISLREASVLRLAGERFELAEAENHPEAVLALLVLVRGVWEQVIDVAAFTLDRPAEAHLLDGRAALLGEHHVRNPASSFADPLPVYPDGLEWLRANGDGLVVLDGATAARRLDDADVPFIEAHDRAHARRLNRLLPTRRAVQVVVRRKAAA